MQPIQAGFVRRCLTVALVGAVTTTASDILTSAIAQTPAAKAPGASATPQKKYKLEWRDKNWKSVIELWPTRPGAAFRQVLSTGSFNLITPRPAETEFTLPEIIDIINEALTTEKGQQYILIRRARSCWSRR